MSDDAGRLDASTLEERFEAARPGTVGAEEEVMTLDPETLDLVPRAHSLLAGLPEQELFKLELPASQLEIMIAPCASIAELVSRLGAARRRLVARLEGRVAIAAAGVHPFARGEGPLNAGARYERIAHEYGWAARRQLICGLHVHVGVGGAARALAVYNALRSYLPQLAALGANAPIHEGRDSGMASVRPAIAAALPRQGVPPAIESFAHYADELHWGRAAGRLVTVREWWWELRLHPRFGTVEVRVPDAQTTLADAGALITAAALLVRLLTERYDAGDLHGPAASWRIGENRWSAARHGVHGRMSDLDSGRMYATRDRLHALLDELRPLAEGLGVERELEHAHELAESGGADRQRSVFAEQGAHELVRVLATRFLA